MKITINNSLTTFKLILRIWSKSSERKGLQKQAEGPNVGGPVA